MLGIRPFFFLHRSFLLFAVDLPPMGTAGSGGAFVIHRTKRLAFLSLCLHPTKPCPTSSLSVSLAGVLLNKGRKERRPARPHFFRKDTVDMPTRGAVRNIKPGVPNIGPLFAFRRDQVGKTLHGTRRAFWCCIHTSPLFLV